MATIPITNPFGASGVNPSFNSKGALAQWSPMTNAGSDVGAPYDDFGNTDRSIQLSGTLGVAGAVTIEGSNDGVIYYTLKDQGGVAMVLTALGLYGFQPGLTPRFVRPRVTAGDGSTSLTVLLLARRPMNS